MAKKERCKGERRCMRHGAFGTYNCLRHAKGTVETQVGFTVNHPCCGGDECIASIAKGYPAQWKPWTK